MTPIPHPGDIAEGPVRRSSSQAGLAAVKYGPKISPAPRPFQVGDRVEYIHPRPSGLRHKAGTVVEVEPVIRVKFDGYSGRGWHVLAKHLAHLPTDPSGGAVTAPTPAPSGDTTPDHGPLAATLSDRTRAKVLSRPAHGMARVFGFNVVTIDPEGNPGGPRLDGVVSRQRALDELDELEPFMVDGYTTVLVELREVTS